MVVRSKACEPAAIGRQLSFTHAYQFWWLWPQVSWDYMALERQKYTSCVGVYFVLFLFLLFFVCFVFGCRCRPNQVHCILLCSEGRSWLPNSTKSKSGIFSFRLDKFFQSFHGDTIHLATHFLSNAIVTLKRLNQIAFSWQVKLYCSICYMYEHRCEQFVLGEFNDYWNKIPVCTKNKTKTFEFLVLFALLSFFFFNIWVMALKVHGDNLYWALHIHTNLDQIQGHKIIFKLSRYIFLFWMWTDWACTIFFTVSSKQFKVHNFSM